MSRSEGTGHALGSISGRLLKVGIAVDDVPGTGLSAFVLKVRFQEPQRLVEGPGFGRENVRGRRISLLARLVDRLSHHVRHDRKALDQRIEVIVNCVDVGWVGIQIGARRHRLKAAKCYPAKLRHPLGDGVGVPVEFGPETVDHFVHGDEVRAFKIPMRLFAGEREIDCQCQIAVEQRNDRCLGVGRQVVPGRMGFNRTFPCGCVCRF